MYLYFHRADNLCLITDRVHFIDYEFAMYNYEHYDIAHHFCEYTGMDRGNVSICCLDSFYYYINMSNDLYFHILKQRNSQLIRDYQSKKPESLLQL